MEPAANRYRAQASSANWQLSFRVSAVHPAVTVSLMGKLTFLAFLFVNGLDHGSAAVTQFGLFSTSWFCLHPSLVQNLMIVIKKKK